MGQPSTRISLQSMDRLVLVVETLNYRIYARIISISTYCLIVSNHVRLSERMSRIFVLIGSLILQNCVTNCRPMGLAFTPFHPPQNKKSAGLCGWTSWGYPAPPAYRPGIGELNLFDRLPSRYEIFFCRCCVAAGCLLEMDKRLRLNDGLILLFCLPVVGCWVFND
jgi:hypothetical protein